MKAVHPVCYIGAVSAVPNKRCPVTCRANGYLRTHWGLFGLLLVALATALEAKAEPAGATTNQIRWDGEAFEPACWTPQSCGRLSLSESIAQWIKQLGDSEQAKRAQAAQVLTDMGAAARNQLTRVSRESDPEMAARATAVLEAIQRIERGVGRMECAKVFAIQLPWEVQFYNQWLALLGDHALPQSSDNMRFQLSLAELKLRAGQIPFFLVMADHYWHPVPVWIGPRMAPVPGNSLQPPLQVSVELTEYDLLTELDERWQPTTPRAKARVEALNRYLELGGSFNGWMLPMVPVPAWVETLRTRMVQGDVAAVEMLFNLDAGPSAEDLRQLAETLPGPAALPLLRFLPAGDSNCCAAIAQRLLNGRYANDAPLLGLLGKAGVVVDIAKLNYPVNEVGPELIDYCRTVGVKVPDGLLEDYVGRCIKRDIFVDCSALLTEELKVSLRKTLLDQAVSERARFHARCLLFKAGDKDQESELMKCFPAGTPYQNGYNSANLGEYTRGTLESFALPGRIRQLLKEELFDSDKIGPSVESILWKGGKLTQDQVAELVRKLDRESIASMSWHLGDWHCRAAVPKMVDALDAWDFESGNQYDYHKVIYGLRECADPASGPCLVRALDKIEKTTIHMTLESRLKVLEALMRIGADFPGGKASFLREIAKEKRFSVFRLVSLAGLAKVDPVEGLALLLKELDAAPPVVLPIFIDYAAATRLSGVVPALQKHLDDHYPPAAMAAAMGLLNLGDRTGLRVVHKLRGRYAKDNKALLAALMSYWKPDTPPEELRLIRECLDAYVPGKPCHSKEEYRRRFGLPEGEEPFEPPALPGNPMWFAGIRR